jgi:glycosyltransferase involved in cell wall biosynthesis
LLLRSALEERGHSVVLLSTTGGDADFEIPCTVTNATRAALSATGRMSVARSALWNSAAAQETERLIEGVRPHVIHTHKLYPQLSVAPIVIARRRGIPIVQTVHDYEFISANPLDHSGGLLDRLEPRLSYRLLNDLTFVARRRVHVPAVDEWVSVSNAVAQRHGPQGNTMTVLPNFVEQGTKAASGARDGVVFIGRLTEEKGVRHVIELARALPQTAVTLAGWGPLSTVVEVAGQELANLEFAGRIEPDAVQELLSCAQVAVVPSLWEEPGAVGVLEAMAAGTPLVVYRKGGIAEYVGDSGAGLVVDATVPAMSNAVQTLLRDDRLWSSCSERGLESVASTHSIDTYVQRLIGVYEQAMGQA